MIRCLNVRHDSDAARNDATSSNETLLVEEHGTSTRRVQPFLDLPPVNSVSRQHALTQVEHTYQSYSFLSE